MIPARGLALGRDVISGRRLLVDTWWQTEIRLPAARSLRPKPGSAVTPLPGSRQMRRRRDHCHRTPRRPACYRVPRPRPASSANRCCAHLGRPRGYWHSYWSKFFRQGLLLRRGRIDLGTRPHRRRDESEPHRISTAEEWNPALVASGVAGRRWSGVTDGPRPRPSVLRSRRAARQPPTLCTAEVAHRVRLSTSRPSAARDVHVVLRRHETQRWQIMRRGCCATSRKNRELGDVDARSTIRRDPGRQVGRVPTRCSQLRRYRDESARPAGSWR